MPRVNLLPVKAARRRDTAKNELYAVIGIVVLTLVGLYLWYAGQQSELAAMNARLAEANRDIKKLLQDVSKVQDFQGQQKNVEQKLQVIQQLQAKKVGPARMLDELANILTNESKRVWLISLEEKGGLLVLRGSAMEAEDISEFQIALSRAEYFYGVKLEEMKTKTDKDIVFLDWKITCRTRYKAG